MTISLSTPGWLVHLIKLIRYKDFLSICPDKSDITIWNKQFLIWQTFHIQFNKNTQVQEVLNHKKVKNI